MPMTPEEKREHQTWVLHQLLAVGTDSQEDTIQELACKAGFWWRCSECSWVNDDTSDHCEQCQEDRPRKEG